MSLAFAETLARVRACQLCAPSLPFGARPVLQIGAGAKILVAGQAPGRKVHESGVPFSDASGERLRAWMGIDATTFYDPGQIAILPMGFCYPGTGTSGDLPPRPECAIAWRDALMDLMPCIELTLVIGQYAIDWHLKTPRDASLTATVQDWKRYWPTRLPVPHPSPRNNIWLKRNPWFDAEVLPELKSRIASILNKRPDTSPL